MVYCGKASQGCQNCRTRRIKCDKVKPECSQCVRAGKKCAGYRDQLSLMFRDESTKVMQKAHAQWGLSEGSASFEGGIEQLPLTTTPTTTPTISPSPSRPQLQLSPVSPASSLSGPKSSDSTPQSASWPLYVTVAPTFDQQGVQFYIHQYVIGHPDEPKVPDDVWTSASWVHHPALQDIMAATGLAGLANLTGNKDMMTVARQRYGRALRGTGQLVQSTNAPPLVIMRGVVMLALFEVVKETHQSSSTPYAHIMGGAALVRSWLPIPSVPDGGFRALLQLCYTMFIPIHASGKALPPVFIDWISFTSLRQPPGDRPSSELAKLVGRFVQISAFVRRHVLSDGNPKTGYILRQLMGLDRDLRAWESNATADREWLFKRARDDSLPRQAVFDGEYHVYNDLWTARVWNHYRWARVLTNQMMLEFVNQYPLASLPILSVAQQSDCYETIRQIARDTLVSVPSHWRHPLLPPEHHISVENTGTAGSGAAGVPPLLFQVKVAACAPGVPLEYWEWAIDIVQCVWGDLGMMHALSMMETLKAHRDAIENSDPDSILAHHYDYGGVGW